MALDLPNRGICASPQHVDSPFTCSLNTCPPTTNSLLALAPAILTPANHDEMNAVNTLLHPRSLRLDPTTFQIRSKVSISLHLPAHPTVPRHLCPIRPELDSSTQYESERLSDVTRRRPPPQHSTTALESRRGVPQSAPYLPQFPSVRVLTQLPRTHRTFRVQRFQSRTDPPRSTKSLSY